MNTTIARYFDEIEERLLSSGVVAAYSVLRREIAPSDGKLRVKAILSDGGTAELFEYVTEAAGRVTARKYSFHWQDAQGKLVRRWDNAPHYPVRDHSHEPDGAVAERAGAMNMLEAIEEIEKGASG
jgi:hypothetical protein